MINSVFECITDKLENYFNMIYSESAPKILVSNIVGHDGELVLDPVTNQVVLTLINVEGLEFGSVRDYSNKPQHIQLTFVVSVFTQQDYMEGLSFLSSAIAFFQENPVFTDENTPQLDDRISKLEFSIATVALQDINGIWGAMGAKYLPSVVYRVKTLTYTSTN